VVVVVQQLQRVLPAVLQRVLPAVLQRVLPAGATAG